MIHTQLREEKTPVRNKPVVNLYMCTFVLISNPFLVVDVVLEHVQLKDRECLLV